MLKSCIDYFVNNFLLEKGQLMVVGARPSVGKSTLMQNIVQHVSMTINIPIGYFSHVKKPLLLEKMIISQKIFGASGVNLAEEVVSKFNVIIDDRLQITMNELDSAIETMVRKYHIQLLVIDGFENIYTKNTSTDETVSVVFPYLKKLAQGIDIPIIITVGLSRDLENRNDKRPRLTDLNNYRVIEQNANTIVYIYRDEIYEECSKFKGLAHIRFENLDGRNNRTNLMTFDGKNSCFREYIPSYYKNS